MINPKSEEYRQVALSMNYQLEALFQKNLNFFKKQDTSISNSAANYQPKRLTLKLDPKGYVNLYNIKTNQSVYPCDPEKYAKEQVDLFFAKRPNYTLNINIHDTRRDDHPYNKCLRKIIAKYVELKSDRFFEKQSYSEQMFMFGGGLYLQLQHILNEIDVKSLTIFEVDFDAFYASMHVINWSEIYRYFDREGYSLSINFVSCDTKEYIKVYQNMMMTGLHRFAKIDLYYHYLNDEINYLAENIEGYLSGVLGGLGYFEDERQGLVHTLQNIEKKIPFRQNTFESIQDIKLPPVLLIANGPSLDDLSEFIADNQNKFVLISCGTSLVSLERKGIKPDIHLEQERITLVKEMIATKTSDAFRKKIKFIGLNTCHSGVFDLFDESFMALKDSDLGCEQILKAGVDRLNTLKHSNPLVANFGLSMAIDLGFKEIYLAGVDCGMVIVDKHHPTDSLYSKGEVLEGDIPADEILTTKGNFRDTVFTTDLYNKSKLALSLKLKDAPIECFNMSDGAYIEGTKPSRFNEVGVSLVIENKEGILNALFKEKFSNKGINSKILLDSLAMLVMRFNQIVDEISPLMDITGLDVSQIIEAFDKVENILMGLIEHEMNIYTLLNGSVRGLMVNLVTAKKALDPQSFIQFYLDVKPRVELFIYEIKQQMAFSLTEKEIPSI